MRARSQDGSDHGDGNMSGSHAWEPMDMGGKGGGGWMGSIRKTYDHHQN